MNIGLINTFKDVLEQSVAPIDPFLSKLAPLLILLLVDENLVTAEINMVEHNIRTSNKNLMKVTYGILVTATLGCATVHAAFSRQNKK